MNTAENVIINGDASKMSRMAAGRGGGKEQLSDSGSHCADDCASMGDMKSGCRAIWCYVVTFGWAEGAEDMECRMRKGFGDAKSCVRLRSKEGYSVSRVSTGLLSFRAP